MRVMCLQTILLSYCSPSTSVDNGIWYYIHRLILFSEPYDQWLQYSVYKNFEEDIRIDAET